MNNMLYIIAGLIIILIIAVLVLIRKKAQEPSAAPQLKPDSKAKDTTPKPADIAKTPAVSADSSATKFDSLTVAQRFMDQQRYDKAVETLKRGLISKPNDSKLLLKLLNVYAITDEDAEFNNTYALISTHGDSATIEQAQRLKGLVDEEVEQEQALHTSVEADENAADYASLDFDLPIADTDTELSSTDKDLTSESLAPVIASEPAPVSSAPTDDNVFDLILDDLDDLDHVQDSSPADAIETERTNEPVISLNSPETELSLSSSPDSPVIETPVMESPVLETKTNDYAADNIDDDFSFDFDDLSEDSSVDSISIDEPTDELAVSDQPDLSDDDFVLDFDDLTADIDTDVSSDISTDIKTETEVKTETSHDLNTDINTAIDTNIDTDIETNIETGSSADDFDLAIHDTEEHDIAITAPVAQDSIEDDFTLFLDDTEFGATDEATSSSPSTTDSSIDIGLEDDILDTEHSESDVLGSSVADTVTQLDALSLSDNLAIEEPTTTSEPQADELSTNIVAPISDGHDLSDVEDAVSESHPTLETELDLKEPDAEDSDVKTLVMEDSQFKDSDVKDSDIKDSGIKDSAPTLTVDDDAAIADLDFDFDDTLTQTPTPATAPVSTPDETPATDVEDIEAKVSSSVPVTEVSAQFAADFDFIKTLDSQQVTLDLAEQYLQLGEYDSAKRLLNEVMTQGDNAQQQQAKALLARTA